ncbi:uncharacterized protein LOC110640642 [Hevea brasiliensis]|uniref:uncharacterized protein LOC110640642 n=1 Tax=Hevea brasiliensis TaxID=3981 RepID=UPI0025CE8B59|nr:uncharacterized protein LOC110640642 [Hevea brasiliensis]
MALIIFLVMSVLLHGALGELVCEQLPVELCSYSIASSGKRCLLENFPTKDGEVKYQCKTSEVVVDIMQEWIESDECVSSCGLDRNTVGISSDALLQAQFLAKLCSNDCYQACPNIVDLYFNLALGEGISLPLNLFFKEEVKASNPDIEVRKIIIKTKVGAEIFMKSNSCFYGVYLPDLCANPRRSLSATRSSGYAAPGPLSGLVSPAAAPITGDVDPACAPSAI